MGAELERAEPLEGVLEEDGQLARVRQHTLYAGLLDRRHIGMLVKVQTDAVSVVGRLDAVESVREAGYDWTGTPANVTGWYAGMQVSLRVSGWGSPALPGDLLVTVEEVD